MTGQVILNKYRIESLVGEGGFGRVYKATHLQLNALRALKILQRNNAGVDSNIYNQYLQRFQQEAQLGAQLEHPHTIRVYDFEQFEDTLMLVMEYAPGGSLADLIERGRKQGKPIHVDEAVRYVREAAEGLEALHQRDLVHRDIKPGNILLDGQGRAKVSDFGLVQFPHLTGRSTINQNAAHPGTPAYMSPEQRDITIYLTPASDIYALGLVLFELLTGRIYKSLRPGTTLHSLQVDVPAWLENFLGKMLANDPQQRPWDGAEVAETLKMPGNSADTNSTFAPRTNISQMAEISQITGQISHQPIQHSPEEAERLVDEAFSAGNLDEKIRLCTQAVNLDPDCAQAFSIRGKAYREKGNDDQAIADSSKAIELDPRYTSRDYENRGMAYRHKGNYDQAMVDLNKAIEIDHHDAWLYACRGETFWLMGKYDQAIVDFDSTIEELRDNEDDSLESWVIVKRGETYKILGKYKQAIDDLSEAIWFNDHSARLYASRGETYWLMGKYDQAIVDFDSAIKYAIDDEKEEWDDIDSENDVVADMVIAMRGETYRILGRPKQALIDLDRAIALNCDNAWAMARRGETYRKLRKFNEAIQEFTNALKLEPADAFTYVRRAAVYLAINDNLAAKADLAKAKELSTEKSDLYNYAIALILLNEHAEAITILKQDFEHHPGNRIYALTDDLLDPLQDFPEYQVLLGGT